MRKIFAIFVYINVILLSILHFHEINLFPDTPSNIVINKDDCQGSSCDICTLVRNNFDTVQNYQLISIFNFLSYNFQSVNSSILKSSENKYLTRAPPIL
jgi:hypothetical protein